MGSRRAVKLKRKETYKISPSYKEKENRRVERMSTYPDEEKISKNPITANTYKKIRELFKRAYIHETFDNPLQPREEAFLQWIKKYLNQMEIKLNTSPKP